MPFRTLIRRAVGGTGRAARRSVRHATLALPPAALRRCTVEFKDDRYFLGSARAEAGRLIDSCGLTPAGRLLDVGCGAGRLALGIIDVLGGIGCYEGIDVDRHAIAWCRRWITPAHPAFRFTHLDIRNARYNPSGGIRLDGRFRFDFPDGSFDVIYLYSVFTHMEPPDIRVYLRELRRLLAPGGRIFMTAYVEDGVPDVSINPPGYRQASATPLHRVRLSRRWLQDLLADHGLAALRFDDHAEHDRQTGIYVGAVGDQQSALLLPTADSR